MRDAGKAGDSMTHGTLAVWGQGTQTHLATAEALARALDGAGLRTGAVTALSGTAPDGIATGAGPVILLTERAEDAVLRLLAEGHLPSAALGQWIEDCTALLTVFRARRRGLTLVSVRHALTAPAALAAALAARLGLDAAVAHEDLAAVAETRPRPAQWQKILALQSIAQDPDALRLDAELDASMLPLGTDPADPDAAFSDICALQCAAAETRDLMRRQHEGMLSLRRHDRDRQQRLAALEADTAGLQDARTALEDARSALEQDVSRLEALCREQDAQIRDLYASTSWKVTGPLRGAKRALASRRSRPD